MLTEAEIIDRGIIKNVPLTLDDGDEHEPAGHWFNTSGTRLYSLERVEYAEELLQSKPTYGYVHSDAEFINHLMRPCSPAIFIFDYRIVLSAIDHMLVHRIASERLSHPVMGRLPGSRDREYNLIESALKAIIKFVDPKLAMKSSDDVLRYFAQISESAPTSLGDIWPNVILRRPGLRYNISRGKSKKAATKLLNVLSLVHVGQLSHELIDPRSLDIIELLSVSPALRVDHKVMSRSN